MILATYIHLLQTLGVAIINSLWQAALVWLCYVAMNVLFNLSSSKKYLLTVICELIIFIWFIVSFINNLFPGNHSSPAKIFTQVIPSLNKDLASSQVLPILSFTYLVVLTGMLFKWLINFYHTQKTYRHNVVPFETQWQQWIEQKARQLNIKKTIKIFVTNHVHVPLTIGMLKPVILLPVAIANYLTVEELETILLHELAHIKRADYLINILLSLVETVLYFNPFIFYFRKIIKKERENICDDEVLLQYCSPVQYAESLLKVAKFSLNKKEIAFAMSAANNHHQQLLQRIQRITKTEVKQKNSLLLIFSATLLITAFAALSLLYIPSSSSHNSSTNNKKNVLPGFSSAINLPVTQKNIEIKYSASVKPKKDKQKNSSVRVTINTNKADENLNVALENLKQITIPGLQNNIEEYRKSLSGKAAQQLADNNLKLRIKNYVSAKNISINDFIRKVDSIKINQEDYSVSVTGTNNNAGVIIPASYIEKDSLDQYIQQHTQIKHFVILPNNNESPYYLIIRSTNQNKEPLFIFIPYTPARSAD